jgi:hypothetical protein
MRVNGLPSAAGTNTARKPSVCGLDLVLPPCPAPNLLDARARNFLSGSATAVCGREIRGRTRVVGASPDSQSAPNLAPRPGCGTSPAVELLKDQQMRGAITA